MLCPSQCFGASQADPHFTGVLRNYAGKESFYQYCVCERFNLPRPLAYRRNSEKQWRSERHSKARDMARGLSETDVADFRERLCETAAQLFVERGPSAFNMRELAARLGVSAMTPYRYFKDKNEILAVVRARAFRRFADRLEGAHATDGSQLDKSAAMGRAYVTFALEERTNYRLMFDLAQPGGATIPELESQERRARGLMRAHVDMLVEMGVLEGDAGMIAKIFWAALHGVIVLHLAGKLASVNFDRLLSETMRVIANAYRPVKVTAHSEIPAAHEWPTIP